MPEKTYVAIDLEPERIVLGVSSPLHMTLTPPVTISSAETTEIEQELVVGLRGFGAIMLRGAEDDYFGPHSAPVHVRKFVRTPELLGLHNRILSVVQKIVPKIDLTYTGDRYQPHATYKDEQGIGEGEVRRIEEVTILRKENGLWRRAGIVTLGAD